MDKIEISSFFRLRGNGEKENFNLLINGQRVKREHESKYLGLIISDDLKWEKHIKKLIKDLNKHIPIYYILRNYLPRNKVLMIYKSLSLSKINYAIEIYGKKNNQWMSQLQKTQNRLLKIILKKHFYIIQTYCIKIAKY